MARREGWGLELVLFALAAAAFGLGSERLWTRGVRSPATFELVPAEAGVLRVATWNVGSGLASGVTELDEAQLEHVAESLRRLDPDLCFLQELASRGQARRLHSALGPGWEAPELSSRPGRRTAVFARRGALVGLDAGLDDRDGRAVLALYRPERGPWIAAMGIHASAFSAAERNHVVGDGVERVLAAAAAESSASGGRERAVHAILAGDLNVDIDLDKRRDLFTDDAYLDVETYNHAAQRFDDVARGTGSTAEPDRRLDYLFVGKDAFEVVRAGPWRGLRRGAMDHDPVVADLRAR